MRFLHSSDLHGRWQRLLPFEDFDVWIDSGDFFPNWTRGDRRVEAPYQTQWFNEPRPTRLVARERLAYEELADAKEKLSAATGPAARGVYEEDVWDLERNWFHARDDLEEARSQPGFKPTYQMGKRLARWLDGRPLISVPGNHDYVSLAKLMKRAGARAYQATTKGVEVDGIEYAGFREIPWIHGEWAGETQQGDFRGLVDEVFDTPPDILVTHAGPANIMTGSDEYHGGINQLMTALSYRSHSIRAHFFGHDHDFGSQTRQEVGVVFSNSATKPKIVSVPGL